MSQIYDFGFPPEAAFGIGGLINMDASSLSEDKIAIAVLKTRQLASLSESYQMDSRADVLCHLQSQCDKLLGFLMTQFTSLPSSAEVHEMMHQSGRVNVLDVDQVRGLSEAMIPVTIVRELIRTHKIPMNPHQIPNWIGFMNRYKSQVMSA